MQTAEMRPRDVLAENLRKLMAATPSLRTIEMLVGAGAGTTGTLDRIKRKESATGVDNLEALAGAFGLKEPWQLLVPTLTASEGQDGRPVIGGMPEWPFPKVPRDRWEALDEADRGYVQRKLLQAIDECASATPRPDAPSFFEMATPLNRPRAKPGKKRA